MKPTRIVCILIALFAICTMTSEAMAKDIFVRVDANGDGSKASPYGTVDEALREWQAAVRI